MKTKNYTFKKRCCLWAMLIAGSPAIFGQVTQSFTYTGAMQTFTVPACVSTITLDVQGSKGGDCIYNMPGTRPDDPGGKGGRVVAVYPVTAGQVFNIFVGGVPYNGGGNGGGTLFPQGHGGGASDIRVNGVALTDRIIVAGGGGGGGNNCTGDIEPGGDGGGLVGGAGWECGGQVNYVGTGGTQSAGGTCIGLNPGTFGALGIGGNAGGAGTASGGGGGGYYGGAGSGYGGAGGGSSYTDPSMTAVTHTQGANTGTGIVTLTYDFNGAGVIATATPSLFCTGATSTLEASNVLSYTWSPGGSNSTSLTVTPTSNTSYTVRGTNSLGCISTVVLTLSVNTTPTVTINSSTTSACQGQSVTLTANGANTYTWNNSVSNGVAFAPSATSLYTVTGTNACGTATAEITVTVSALPVTASASSTLICSASPATLTAGGATTYTWMPGTSTQTNYIVSPASTVIYTVTGKTGNCIGTNTIAVHTKTLPTISIATPSTAICNGNSINLTAMGDAVTYSWSVGQTGPSISVSPANTSIYVVTGTNVVNCTKSVSQLIQVYQNPIVNISTSNADICPGGTATLSASGADGYDWGNGTGGIVTHEVNPTATTVYSVTGTSTLTGCHTTTMITVNVFLPVISVSSNTSVCTGSNITIGASGAVSYTWINNSSTAQNINVAPTANTIYTVMGSVVDPQSSIVCDAMNTVEVNVFPSPVITASSNYTAICRGTTASLTADGAGATGTYTWTGGYGNTAVISVSPILNQSYNVSATDVNGCRGTASVQVLVSPCTGVNAVEADRDQLIIFPNPSSGEITIESDGPMTLTLINELGQEVKVINITGAEKKTTLKDLTSGVYFVIGVNGNIKQKIVVAK